MTTRVAALFPTPVYTTMLDPRRHAALRAAILDRRGRAAGVAKSNVGGWQSDDDMLRWGGEPALALAREVVGVSGRVVAPLDGKGGSVRWQPEMWANINRAGDSNQSHWHPGSLLSFVYYLDDGYGGSSDAALGGQLVFVDPRMPFLRMRTPDLRHRGANGDADEHETWVRPATGLLIGFPAFLSHSVRPYHGRGERISIAINMVAREPAA